MSCGLVSVSMAAGVGFEPTHTWVKAMRLYHLATWQYFWRSCDLNKIENIRCILGLIIKIPK